jgi:hypothetical protein
MFAWGWRDGMGPESYESTGLVAVNHFLLFYTPWAFIGSVLLLSGFIIKRIAATKI